MGLPLAPRPMSASNGADWVATMSGCGVAPAVEATSLYAEPSRTEKTAIPRYAWIFTFCCFGASTRSCARAAVGVASATKAAMKRMRT